MIPLFSKLASFLGDPDFPKVATGGSTLSSTGSQTRLYQDLYMEYSRLGFTHQQDRPVAIAGLEQRLIQSFGVHGGFGVLDDRNPGLLRRSLLWHRAQETASLGEIDFAAPGAAPPTWSWMAYTGAIDYLELPFGQVEWERTEILSPWASSPVGRRYSSDDSAGTASLSVLARDFVTDPDVAQEDVNVILDTSSVVVWSDLKCVVLGRSKGPLTDLGTRTHFVLLVAASKARRGRDVQFRRMGIASMPGIYINQEQLGTLGKIR